MNKKIFFSQNFNHNNGGYGYLYNLYAASNLNFAPTDWKVPTDSEYTTLTDYIGGLSVAGGYMKEIGFTHWDSPNTGADNSYNFTALGSGVRSQLDGLFYSIKSGCYLGSSTPSSSSSNWIRILGYASASVNRSGFSKKTGVAIRLIYVGTNTPASTITDYDGNEYDVIQIGSQYWLKQNWKCTHLNDGTELTKVTDNTTWSNATSGNLYYCAYDNDESNV